MKTKEQLKEYNKAYMNSMKDDFYSLYYLPEEHYIGVSNQPKIRMYNHKYRKRHVLNYEIVCVFKTREEAVAVESYMHSIGYNGKRLNKLFS